MIGEWMSSSHKYTNVVDRVGVGEANGKMSVVQLLEIRLDLQNTFFVPNTQIYLAYA